MSDLRERVVEALGIFLFDDDEEIPADFEVLADRLISLIRAEVLEEAARECRKVRVRLASSLTPEGARYDYENAILALKEKQDV